jgi:hypothetical protein
MTISFPCIRLFVFVARIAPPHGIAICVFLNTCANTRMPKITVFLSKICHFDIALLRFCRPLQLLQRWWQRDSVACAIAAARMLRRWRQRDRASRRQLSGGASAAAASVAVGAARRAAAMHSAAAAARLQQRGCFGGGGSATAAQRHNLRSGK